MSTTDLQSYDVQDAAPGALDEDIVPVEEIERGLGFTDGFQFGCGFWVAALVVAIIVGLGFLILTFLLSFVGINLL